MGVSMEDLTKYLLEIKSFKIYRNGSNRAYLLSGKVDREIDSKEIKYQAAEKLQTGDIFLNYSPSMENACQYQFLTPYKVIDKVDPHAAMRHHQRMKTGYLEINTLYG